MKKLLVLGGTGFVGSRFIAQASQLNYQIYSISRRGNTLTSDQKSSTRGITPPVWISGDATDKATIEMVISKYGPFDGYVHCIGLLFDSKSGLKSLNQYASGSSSIPGDSVTYDDITRRTAFNLIEAVEKVACDADQTCKNNIPLVFISAAEAGWTFKAPVDFLERYLLAKRSVEKRLLEQSPIVRAVVMRPSLIWTWDRPQGLLSVIPFYIGSKIGDDVGLPFVDRPVTVESLVRAMIVAIQDPSQRGIKRYESIDDLASRPLSRD